MQIGSGASVFITNHHPRANNVRPQGEQTSFAELTQNRIGSGAPTADYRASDIEYADFTNMTAENLMDWVNGQIKSGEMSLDGTEAFVAMTIRMPLDGSAPGPMANEPVNFMEGAQKYIEYSAWKGDEEAVNLWRGTLKRMQEAQGQVSRLNLTV